MLFFGPATTALHEIKDSDYVRFSLLALSSIFFLVDPFAAIGTFMAITAGEDSKSRARTARRGALTCFIVLTSFALIGKLIFRMFGITLPAFETAGGLILLLIGIDMLEAERSRIMTRRFQLHRATHEPIEFEAQIKLRPRSSLMMTVQMR